MPSPKQSPNTPQWILNRCAERAPDVVLRHQDKPLVAVYAATTPAVAGAYRQQYAAVNAQEDQVQRLTVSADAAVLALSGATSTAVRRLGTHLHDVDLAALTRTGVATDIIFQSEDLLQRVRLLLQDEEVPYGEQLLTHLEGVLEQARTATQARHDALVALQEQRQALRDAGIRLEDELVALRRALREALGSQHRDYHHLLVPKTRAEIEAFRADTEPPFDDAADGAGQEAEPGEQPPTPDEHDDQAEAV